MQTVSESLDSRFCHQLWHTERLVREFYPAIKVSALHIYYSALAFAPQCALSTLDSIQIPGLPRMVSGRRTQWTNMFGKIDAHKGSINSGSYSRRGNLIISGSEDHDVRLWNSKTGEDVALLRAHTSWVRSAAFSFDEHWIVSGDDNGIVILWDAVTRELLSKMTGHIGAVNSVSFTPDSQRIISSSDDRIIRIWDRSTGSCIATLEGHSAPVLSAACSPDGEKIISGSQDSTVRIWCSNSGILINIFQRHWGPVRSVAYSPTSHLVASGSDDRLIHLWNAQTGQRFKTLMGHMDPVRSVAFSSDGASLVSGSSDSTIRIWDTTTADCKMTFRDFTGSVRSVALSPDGNTALSGSDGHSICIWDISFGPDQQVHQSNEDLTGDITSLALSSSGDRIASSSTNEYGIQIRDLSTGEKTLALIGHSDQVNSLDFSMDGQYLLSGSEDGTIRVWDAKTNYTGQTLIHDSPVRTAIFAPFGNRIVSIGTEDDDVCWWQLESRSGFNARLLLQKHSDWVRSAAFSPGGRWIASGAADNTVCMWDPLSSHTPALVLRGHEDWVECVAFSPDGRFLASGSDDCTVRVWDLFTGRTITVFTDHTHSICSIAFSLDGQELISRDSIGIVRTRPIFIETSSEQPKLSFPQTSTAWQNSRLAIPGYMVDLESGWVYHIADAHRAPERRCWLPPYRRPSETVPPVWHKDTLVTGAQSGIISIIDFSFWQTNIRSTAGGGIQG
jgi:WD40 repeat protein